MGIQNFQYDAVVVGAGPAGSLAAESLAKSGHSVLLLEKHREIGIPLCCAEAISLKSLALFCRPDPKWIAAPINGAVLYSPDGTEVAVPWPEVGYVLERKLFDRWLAQRAAEAGTHVLVNAEAVGLISSKNGDFSGVTVLYQNQIHNISCRAIIGADGVESLTGAWAGLNTALKSTELHSCMQYLMSGIDGPPNMARFWVGKEIAPGGYLWVFPKDAGLANVGLGILGSLAGQKKPGEYLDRFLIKHFPKAQIIETMAGGTPALEEGHPMAAKNVLLAGDAARLTDPLSGAGIATAMASGQMAARQVAEYLKTGNKKHLENYPSLWWSGLWKDIKYHAKVRKVFLKLEDDDMNRIARFLSQLLKGKEPSKINPIDVAKQVVRSDPGLLLLGRHLL
ncbi:NAD(P)/FAD-dependent oxidoreductase [candidate division TA06 bacterium]|uniref:NAD(P)/FAD-dependent oxidoreductase n=1 Tax=candidate division TA06 bacterium TaxID=2250710 RepID=A0A933MK81_UNCT6|nr:NAD(P)/FAD-dependent oxidoreductase [candidate division TA06 bacterium]